MVPLAMRDGARSNKNIPAINRSLPLKKRRLIGLIEERIAAAIRPYKVFTKVSPYFVFAASSGPHGMLDSLVDPCAVDHTTLGPATCPELKTLNRASHESYYHSSFSYWKYTAIAGKKNG
jgi:hypothetical protein